MPKAKVFVTHSLYPDSQALLQAHCDCEFWTKPDRPPHEEFARRLKDKEGLVCMLTERVGEDVLRAAPKLRIISNVAVGYDNVDVQACTKRGVVVTNTPGVLDETTADFAFALLLAVARRVVEADQYVRAGNWKGWSFDLFSGTDVWENNRHRRIWSYRSSSRSARSRLRHESHLQQPQTRRRKY